MIPIRKSVTALEEMKMAMRKGTYAEKKVETEKVAHSGKPFTDLISQVDMNSFVRMVMKSGLPTSEARELCMAFKALKD